MVNLACCLAYCAATNVLTTPRASVVASYTQFLPASSRKLAFSSGFRGLLQLMEVRRHALEKLVERHELGGSVFGVFYLVRDVFV